MKHSDKKGILRFKELNHNKIQSKKAEQHLRLSAKGRKDVYNGNHESIIFCLSEYIREWKRLPTQNQLSEMTGLSRVTISNHLKDLPIHFNSPEYKSKILMMREELLLKLFSMAKCNYIDPRLELMAIDKFLRYTTPNRDSQAIKINNINIDQITIEQLPIEKKTQILNIINEMS
ncbi:MAG: hypothetical protein KJP00_01905 [Bacteroidia bacterium]|nr:hypothetical protein [Bacteroidia bacterium]